MKTFKNLLLAGILFTLTGYGAGCGGTETGGSGGRTSPALANGLDLPPGTNALLSVRATSGGSQATLALDGVEVDILFLCLEEIELETEATAEDGDTEINLIGPFEVRLVENSAIANVVVNHGSSNIDDDADDDGEEDSEDTDDDGDGTPDSEDADDDDDGVADADDSVLDEIEIFDALTLPAGTYHEIEAELDRCEVEEGMDPASPLANSSLYLEGTANGQPFTVSCDFDEEFEREDPAGIAVDDTSIASFVLSFNLDGLFQGVDFSASNDEICNQLKTNLHDVAEIDNDEDGDGTPDDDEDSGSDDSEDGDDSEDPGNDENDDEEED